MWKTLISNWLKGPLTTAYPNRSEPAPERFRGLLAIRPERCTDPEACMRVCPTGAIAIQDDPERQERRFEVDYAQCIFCGLCAEACGTGAIAMSAAYENAAKNREDLRVTQIQKLPQSGRTGS